MNINANDMAKLDNPAWFSLKETHAKFAVGNDSVKCYDPAYGPFGGIGSQENTGKFLMQYAHLTDSFFIIGKCPLLELPLQVTGKLEGLQMIIYNPIQLKATEQITVLGNEHLQMVDELINLVQPGYFRKQTFYLGNYYGIFKEDQLVAVAGERMKMNGFTEVSAVVTHPEYTGKGYAKHLVAHTVNEIFKQGKIPILHVLQTNISAISLYQKLGFMIRNTMDFWKIGIA